MIITKLRFRNFFSSGNAFLEIDIQKYKKSVISGTNGEGKSTIANAITFALFKKTIKKVTMGQIVNSVNGKGCVVELEFTELGEHYMVRRGIKPNIFELYKGGVLVDQTLSGDYQTYLEEKILKCSYRTFLQTSIISIENYTPFMSLDTKGRREFIEDILDIGVFSTMNTLIKSKNNKNKEELRTLDMSVSALKSRLVLQKGHIDELTEKKKVGIDSLDEKIVQYREEIEEASSAFDDSEEILEKINEDRDELTKKVKRQSAVNQLVAGLRSRISTYQKDIDFFEKNDDCPTCRMSITKEHVHSITDSQIQARDGLKGEVDTLVSELEDYASVGVSVSAVNQREASHNGKISVANSTITRLNRLISGVNAEKAAMQVDDDIQPKRDAMVKDAKEALKLRERQLVLQDEQRYNTIMLELFKDSGIKSKIVDQYIPIINEHVNNYLEKLDFFVSFNLNSEFVETIKSRHRDDFTYSSFSAGEKLRIDMALMFTFRTLAKMRNAFSSNVLMLDEICDASADSAGVEGLISILCSAEFSESNIMVISHSNKDRFEERFDGFYDVYKRDGFTCLKES